jgi:hypothetical protein
MSFDAVMGTHRGRVSLPSLLKPGLVLNKEQQQEVKRLSPNVLFGFFNEYGERLEEHPVLLHALADISLTQSSWARGYWGARQRSFLERTGFRPEKCLRVVEIGYQLHLLESFKSENTRCGAMHHREMARRGHWYEASRGIGKYDICSMCSRYEAEESECQRVLRGLDPQDSWAIAKPMNDFTFDYYLTQARAGTLNVEDQSLALLRKAASLYQERLPIIGNREAEHIAWFLLGRDDFAVHRLQGEAWAKTLTVSWWQQLIAETGYDLTKPAKPRKKTGTTSADIIRQAILTA